MRPLGLTTYQPDKAFRGYTLFAPMRDTSAYLIDMQGAIVHRWQLPYRPGDYGYLLDNGHLLISGQTGKGPVAFGGRGGTVMEMDWDGHVLWEYAEDTLHHDFCRMPNGHTMVLGWERIPAELARRVKGGTPIPPFDIRIGERVAGEGAVFLTSSSASEDSQESD